MRWEISFEMPRLFLFWGLGMTVVSASARTALSIPLAPDEAGHIQSRALLTLRRTE